MNIGTPVESVAAALYACVNNKDIMPDVKVSGRRVEGMFRPSLQDLKVYSFPETWSSTSLGFGGIGGSAMSTAQTTVVFCSSNNNVAVFWGVRHAYSIENAPTAFWEDIKNHRTASTKEAENRYSKLNK